MCRVQEAVEEIDVEVDEVDLCAAVDDMPRFGFSGWLHCGTQCIRRR